ncbi:MAG TPA: hypothetical protein VIK78_14710 [Ruminiclostridium sp.]
MAITINGKQYADGTQQLFNPKTKTYDIVAKGASTAGYQQYNNNTFADPTVNALSIANRDTGGNYDSLMKQLDTYNGSGYQAQAPQTDLAKAVGAQVPQVATMLAQPDKVTATPATDNSGLINSGSEELIKAIKDQIAQATNNKNLSIGGLQDKYQPTRNASEVAKYGEIASLNESAANAGDRGGIGRQNTLAAMIGGENRINATDLQQGSEKASLLNDIANLVLDGNSQEAVVQAQRLKDLVANQNYMDETNYNRTTAADNTNYDRQTAVNNENYNRTQDANNTKLAADKLVSDKATEATAQDFENFKASAANNFGSNYQLEINKLTAENNPANAQKIAYLEQLRGGKVETDKTKTEAAAYSALKTSWIKSSPEAIISSLQKNPTGYMSSMGTDNYNKMLNDALTQIKFNATAATTAHDKAVKDAMASWELRGTKTQAEANILGGKAGDMTEAYKKTQYDISKPYFAPPKISTPKAIVPKSTDALYNSTYAKAVGWKNAYMTEAQVVAGIKATKGLSDQEKADMANGLYP